MACGTRLGQAVHGHHGSVSDETEMGKENVQISCANRK